MFFYRKTRCPEPAGCPEPGRFHTTSTLPIPHPQHPEMGENRPKPSKKRASLHPRAGYKTSSFQCHFPAGRSENPTLMHFIPPHEETFPPPPRKHFVLETLQSLLLFLFYFTLFWRSHSFRRTISSPVGIFNEHFAIVAVKCQGGRRGRSSPPQVTSTAGAKSSHFLPKTRGTLGFAAFQGWTSPL